MILLIGSVLLVIAIFDTAIIESYKNRNIENYFEGRNLQIEYDGDTAVLANEYDRKQLITKLHLDEWKQKSHEVEDTSPELYICNNRYLISLTPDYEKYIVAITISTKKTMIIKANYIIDIDIYQEAILTIKRLLASN